MPSLQYCLVTVVLTVVSVHGQQEFAAQSPPTAAQATPEIIRFGSGEPVRAIRPQQFQIELPNLYDPLREERPKRQYHVGYLRHPTFVPQQRPQVQQFQQTGHVYVAQPNPNVVRQYPFQPSPVVRQYAIPAQFQHQAQPQFVAQQSFRPQTSQYIQPQQPQYPRFDLRPQPVRPVRPVYISQTPRPLSFSKQAAYGDEITDTTYLNSRLPAPGPRPQTGYSERPPVPTQAPYIERPVPLAPRPAPYIEKPEPVRPAPYIEPATPAPYIEKPVPVRPAPYIEPARPAPYIEKPVPVPPRPAPYVEPTTARPQPRPQPPRTRPYVVPTTTTAAYIEPTTTTPRPRPTTVRTTPRRIITTTTAAPTTRPRPPPTTAAPTTRPPPPPTTTTRPPPPPTTRRTTQRTTTTPRPTTTTPRPTTTTPVPTTTTPRPTPKRTTRRRTTTPRPTTTTTTEAPTTTQAYEEAVETPQYDETFVGQYYYGRRGEGGNNTFPLPSCFYNPSGYVCCNLMLNELMTTSFEEVRVATNLCNVHKFAIRLQKHSEKIFDTQFETIVSYEDFSQKIHFKKDLVCKIEIEGRFILAYATPEDVEQEKIIPTVPSREIQKDSVILKEEVKSKIRQIEREL